MAPSTWPAMFALSQSDVGAYSGPHIHPADWSSLIGIVTAIVGNLLISFALNIQRYAHIRLDQEFNEKKGTSPGDQSLSGTTTYGTQQQEIAEERSKLNANGPGPGKPAATDVDGDGDHNEDMQQSFQSDATLRSSGEEAERRKSYLRSPTWWLGIILMTIGETGNFLAYGFAPASIVSPLGVVALISNCLIAPLMLKERFRQRDFWGVLVAVAGAVTVVLSAKQNETKLGPGELWQHYIKRWEFLTYVIITVVCIVVLMILSPRYGTRTILVDIGLVGLFGGYTALSTKGVASLLSTSLYKAFTYPILYPLVLILVASAVMQIRYLNKALQHFDSTQVIPTQFVLFTLSVIIGSAVLYRDFESTTADQATKFIAGCLLTFFGVYLITSGRGNGEEIDEEGYDQAAQEEGIRLIDEEGEEADERTALMKQPGLEVNAPDRPRTPRQSKSPTPSSRVPSILLTPAEESANPWRESTSDVSRTSRPKTPIRSQSDLQTTSNNETPFFTPSTSQPPLRRAPSTPVGAEQGTPTRSRGSTRGASPPKPDPDAAAAALDVAPPSTLRRSARDSIQRLLPGPLMPTLSSSLSGIVAESLLRGEGSPLSVRARLQRNRSSRYGEQARRRSAVQAIDEESGGTGGGTLRRHATHQEARSSAPDSIGQLDDGASLKRQKSRLRSLSETFGGLLSSSSRDRQQGKQGKRREDAGPDRDGATNQ